MNIEDNIDNTGDESKVLSISSPANNFGLTQEEYQVMADKLKNGREDLFEKVFLAQFSDSMQYLKTNYRVEHDLAYDITMNVLIEFRKKILTDKITYGNLRYLFTKMTTQFYLKDMAKGSKEMEVSHFSILEDDDIDIEEKFVALKKAWGEMPSQEKMLLEDFYYKDIPLIKIAERENKTDAALRKQKQRSIEKLRAIFFNNYTDLNT